MKLNILMVAVTLAIFASCGPSYRVTDKTTVSSDTSGVPSAITTSFNSQYPTAEGVTWAPYSEDNLPIDWDLSGWPSMQQGAYVASFMMNNDQYYAWYDSDGNWIGSTYAMRDLTTLPAPVSSTITSTFPGYTVTAANSEMHKSGMAYEIQLKNGDNKAKVLIDSNGKVIKQKTVTK